MASRNGILKNDNTIPCTTETQTRFPKVNVSTKFEHIESIREEEEKRRTSNNVLKAKGTEKEKENMTKT